jgi:hypothetical protein
MTVLSLAREGAPAAAPAVAPTSPPAGAYEVTEDAGIFVARAPGASVFVGLAKGGTLQVDREDGSDIDTGWRIERAGRVYATSVVDGAPAFHVEETAAGAVLRITARFQRYRLLTASPGKTVALRLARFLGPSFNGYFKKRMIVDTEVLSGPLLLRRVEIDRAAGEVRVRDEIVGAQEGDVVRRAPPVSPRLVPSARFHQRDEERAYAGGDPVAAASGGGPIVAERRYRLGGAPGEARPA